MKNNDENIEKNDSLVELAEKEFERLLAFLPAAFTLIFGKILIVNLKIWLEAGYKIGRLKINRIPQKKYINDLAKDIGKHGLQTMGIVITARQAIEAGYEITDFAYNPIPENELDKYIIIPEGQTRLGAIEKIKEDTPAQGYLDYFAHFPLKPDIDLTDLLQSLNTKRYQWKNSDYFTGNSSNVLVFIKGLEEKGYNYTAACEWARLQVGIITKTPLLKAMKEADTEFKVQYFKYAKRVYQKALEKFSGEKETVLKTKTVPEVFIEKWNKVYMTLSAEGATKCIETFIQNLTEQECSEIVNPSGYKRKCGRKKEEFIIDQLNKSFDDFVNKNPIESFKD